jgi:hypothetical protein
MIVLLGCASSPESPGSAGPDDLYLGSGTGESLGEAINAAKMDAVQKAVVDLIGSQAEAAQAARLDEVLYSTRNPNAFVFNETMETLRRDGSLIDGDLVYEIRIRVNVPAVRTTLEANGIGASAGGGGVSTSDAAGDGASTSGAAGAAESTARGSEAGTPAATEPGASGSAATESIPAVEYDEVTPDERRFIARYVDTMTYMVYFADGAAESAARAVLGDESDGAFLMRTAVNQASGYLVNNGRVVVDADQVERLKEDQRLVYEEQSGQELSLLQWVARRLNADVYIELDSRISSRSSGTSHYATADVTLNMYETSTGQILGSVNRRSQESFSRTGVQDAAANALQSTVFQAMPRAVEMAECQMEASLTRGIRYELTLQNPPDARSLSRFRSAMRDDVREIATVNQSPEEILFEVFVVGNTDDLVDLVFSVADRVAGFENINLVISRGRSLTFDVGF